eukprot:Plantae.Rhodophyta-Hildenbrandia_rubra.ctg4631.p1 GENE.Plantae.Rhodophyta-Hildenbrandia_rubra.ctg4631~~Plantae.Rhodophyta-Hildenbrandia_rubra.ctg4631.p1  ORF type:complete len:753 (-),score=159.47 Plantae.Rhodophyta-Hildenbrandia_rubra.ctg4631:1793-4051(-)
MGGTGRSRRAKRVAKHGTGIQDDKRQGTGMGKRMRARKRRLEYEMNRKGGVGGGDEYEVLKNGRTELDNLKRKAKMRKLQNRRSSRQEQREESLVGQENGKNNMKEMDIEIQTTKDDEEEGHKGVQNYRNVIENDSQGSGEDEEESGPDSDGQEDSGEDIEDKQLQTGNDQLSRKPGKAQNVDLADGNGMARKGKRFKDDNVSWLKLKGEESEGDEEESSEESSEDELERGARLIREEEERIQQEATLEAAEQAKESEGPAPFRLETGEVGRGGKAKEDPERQILGQTREEFKLKLQGILTVLSDLKKHCEPDKSRKDYVAAFKELVARCYGYNEELVELLHDIFPLGQLVDFVEASEAPRPLTIRINSLKTRRKHAAQALVSRGVNLDHLPFAPEGLVIYESGVPIGATPEYLAGHYTIQSASSFLPVIALGPQPGERVVDLAASPGGKTTHIGALMQNKGVLCANDFKRSRIKSLVANIHRMGLRNTIVSNYNGTEIPTVFGPMFDRALLDAPCSGTGVISHDASVKTSRDRRDVYSTQDLQKELLLAAIDSVNPKSEHGGVIVYSTCSVLVTENEAVVDYALSKRDVKIEDTGLQIGTEGFTNMRQHRFHPSLKMSRRIYPHIHNLDGFFVCKLRKISNTKKGEVKTEKRKSQEGRKGQKGTPENSVKQNARHAKTNGKDASSDLKAQGNTTKSKDTRNGNRSQRKNPRDKGQDQSIKRIKPASTQDGKGSKKSHGSKTRVAARTKSMR